MKEGDVIREVRSAADRQGQIIAWGRNQKEAEERTEAIRKKVRIEYGIGNLEELRAQLSGVEY